jgi:UDP-glucose 4-epimerase
MKKKIYPSFSENIPGEVRKSALKIKKAIKILGWKPQTDIKKGIKITVDYFNASI